MRGTCKSQITNAIRKWGHQVLNVRSSLPIDSLPIEEKNNEGKIVWNEILIYSSLPLPIES